MPRNDIEVKVVNYGDGRNLMLRYKCPETNKLIAKTAGTRDVKDAERQAGLWEKELQDGTYKPPSKTTWLDFRDKFETAGFKERKFAESTQRKIFTVFKALEESITITKLSALNAQAIKRFRADLEKQELSDLTVRGHLSILRMALNWAHENGYLAAVPTFAMPDNPDEMMKGRPITVEEFNRMLEAVPQCVRQRFDKWRRLLKGLWLSGLRLGEALDLWWDRRDRNHVVLTGRRPMLRFRAGYQKNRKEQLVPITPDFYEFLQAVPVDERKGRVFDVGRALVTDVSDVISRIGEKAEVIVNDDTGKYASAHDLRRSFGERWADKLMPAILQQMMRHKDIKTTMKFYARKNAESVADVVWEAAGIIDAPKVEICHDSCHTEVTSG